MNRPFYTEYVRHCLRFYCRNLSMTRFRSDADKSNWLACHETFAERSDKDRDILVAVYGERDTLADNVYETAKKHGINQAIIWDMLKAVEKEVATRRGLI